MLPVLNVDHLKVLGLVHECESSKNVWGKIETWISNFSFTSYLMNNRKQSWGPQTETFYHQTHIVCH